MEKSSRILSKKALIASWPLCDCPEPPVAHRKTCKQATVVLPEPLRNKSCSCSLGNSQRHSVVRVHLRKRMRRHASQRCDAQVSHSNCHRLRVRIRRQLADNFSNVSVRRQHIQASVVEQHKRSWCAKLRRDIIAVQERDTYDNNDAIYQHCVMSAKRNKALKGLESRIRFRNFSQNVRMRSVLLKATASTCR